MENKGESDHFLEILESLSGAVPGNQTEESEVRELSGKESRTLKKRLPERIPDGTTPEFRDIDFRDSRDTSSERTPFSSNDSFPRGPES